MQCKRGRLPSEACLEERFSMSDYSASSRASQLFVWYCILRPLCRLQIVIACPLTIPASHVKAGTWHLQRHMRPSIVRSLISSAIKKASAATV